MQRSAQMNCQSNKCTGMKFFLTIAACTLLLAVARKKENTPAQLGVNVLEEGNCLTNIKGQSNVSVCFDGLAQDSRCPKDVVCVWQGVAEANFTLKTGTAEIKFKLATLKSHNYRADTTINNIHFVLKSVTPYPGEAGYNNKKKKVALEIK